MVGVRKFCSTKIPSCAPIRSLLCGTIAVCGSGIPPGWRNSATTANQSASPPISAASLKASTQPRNGYAGRRRAAITKTIAITPNRAVAIVFIRRKRARLSSAPANVTGLDLLRGAFRGRRSGLDGLEDLDELVHVLVLLLDQLHGEGRVELADLRDHGRDVAQAVGALEVVGGVGDELAERADGGGLSSLGLLERLDALLLELLDGVDVGLGHGHGWISLAPCGAAASKVCAKYIKHSAIPVKHPGRTFWLGSLRGQ